MARRKMALIAALPGFTWAQSLSDSCYWTSTVIYGAQSTLQTFSSMNPPPPPSGLSSSLASASASARPGITSVSVSDIVSSTVSTSAATSTSTPSISTDEPFIVQVVVAPRKAKRDTQYISFGGEFAILVDDKSSAATFELSEDGHLATDGGNFVGPSSLCEDCKVALLKDEMPPSSPPIWNRWSIDGSSLEYENSTFCIATNSQLFVVFGDDGSDDCQGVSFVGEVAAESTSTSATTIEGTATSSTATSIISDTVTESSLESPPTTTATSSSGASPTQSSTFSPAIQSSSSFLSLPLPSTMSSPAASLISTTTHTTTISIHSSSSNSSPAASSSLSTSRASSSLSGPTITPASTPTSAATSTFASSSPPGSSPPGSTSRSSSSPDSSSPSFTLGSSSAASTTSLMSPPSSSASVSSSRSSSSSSPSSATASPLSPSASSTSVITSASTSITTSTSRSSTTTTTSSSTSSPTPNILPGKRGLAYANVNQTYYYPPPSQVSWAYNYYYAPNSSSSRGIFPRTSSYPLRFIPLLFNDDPSLAVNWIPAASYAIANYGSDALFSFNEPDLCVDGSACMTVQRALVGYNKSMQPFAGQTRLVAPAITNAGSGFTWLRDFLGNASLPQWNLTIDIVNIHWYASPYNMQYFIDYMTQASVIANGRPIWITEYGMDQTYQEPAVLQFMRNTTYWCDQQSFIERYAWFGNYPNNLLNSAGTALSARGDTWNSYVGSNYVYGFNGRVATNVAEAKEVKEPDEEAVEAAKEMGKDGDESDWAREGFVERMWWKGMGHMDGK